MLTMYRTTEPLALLSYLVHSSQKMGNKRIGDNKNMLTTGLQVKQGNRQTGTPLTSFLSKKSVCFSPKVKTTITKI